MVHVLAVLSDGQVRGRREISEFAAQSAGLSPEQMTDELSSGQRKYANRVGWAISYLTNVGALTRPARGQYAITEAGARVLAIHPDGFRERDVESMAADPGLGISGYAPTAPTRAEKAPQVAEQSELAPIEQVEEGVARIHTAVSTELLERLLRNDPAFFERAVVELLVAMGYGGAEGEATVTAQSNDEGIDGVIDQDALGLSRVYVQAKRYAADRAVGRPDLQAFVGALSGKADGGVFITTARFSAGAQEYARIVPTRLILVDGGRLTDLMIRYGVGVQVKETYRVVEVDEDFFE